MHGFLGLTLAVLLAQLYLDTGTGCPKKYAALKPASKRLVNQIAIDLKLADVGNLDVFCAKFFAKFKN